MDVSLIVPVSERSENLCGLLQSYSNAVQQVGKTFEFIVVLDGEYPDLLEDLRSLQKQIPELTIIQFARYFGEATALSAGFSNSSGSVIVTLPPYPQVETTEIPKLLAALEGCDMVVARRSPRIDSTFNRIQGKVFNSLVNFLTNTSFDDLGCSVRAFKREVADEISLYGDQHRFLPILAEGYGYRVHQTDLSQAVTQRRSRVYRPGIYLRRGLDILTVFFLVKFTKKPLRFFGLVGSALFAVGAAALVFVVFERVFMDVALSGRPALLLSSLIVVLGLQLFAIGLLGELIIFTHAKQVNDYTISEIIN